MIISSTPESHFNHMCLALASTHSLNMILIRVYEAAEPRGPLGHPILLHRWGSWDYKQSGTLQGLLSVSWFLFICEFCLSSFDELFPFLNAIFPLCRVAPNFAKTKQNKTKQNKKIQKKITHKETTTTTTTTTTKKQGTEEYSNQNYFIHRLRERTYGYQEGKARGKG